ncbi:hypothetical protein LUW96_16210 [Klebsiella pasteurii]|nr:hypothetical protein LUW96_16210 [Klebsiella pasteurii]
MPFSGVSKSGGGSIAHADGAGRSVRGTSGVELQPTLARSNITFKLIDSGFSICQFSGVFGIQCSNVTLPVLHVSDGGVRHTELFSGFIELLFELGGVVVVVISQPPKDYHQADNHSAGDGS